MVTVSPALIPAGWTSGATAPFGSSMGIKGFCSGRPPVEGSTTKFGSGNIAGIADMASTPMKLLLGSGRSWGKAVNPSGW